MNQYFSLENKLQYISMSSSGADRWQKFEEMNNLFISNYNQYPPFICVYFSSRWKSYIRVKQDRIIAAYKAVSYLIGLLNCTGVHKRKCSGIGSNAACREVNHRERGWRKFNELNIVFSGHGEPPKSGVAIEALISRVQHQQQPAAPRQATRITVWRSR